MFRRKGGALNPALSSASSQPDASAVSNRDMCLNRNPL
jgi:hypothetical protein